MAEVRSGGAAAPIPPDGAVLVARGTAAVNRLRNEAPVGATVRVRLMLQPDWAGVVDAVGGGPALVRAGKAVFNAGEAFVPSQLALPEPRTAVGQLADGRIVLVVVDGRRRGYSSGMTNFELALALVRLGAVTGAALDGGGSSTMAFDGQLLNLPSGAERPVSEALLMVYSGDPRAAADHYGRLAERRQCRREPDARLQARAAVDGDGEPRRARRLGAARLLRPGRSGHVSVHVDRPHR